MKTHQILMALILLLPLIVLSCLITVRPQGGLAQTRPPYASDKPLAEPTLFAEGVISTEDYDSHPAFTPDGQTLYFLKSSPNFNFWTIVVSRWTPEGKWGTPLVAEFSGQYRDADPFITPDGLKLYFISDRPVAGKTQRDLDIWVMEKRGSGWGEPKNLGALINSPGDEWYPTVTLDGTLYFGSDREGGKGRTDLYRSRLVNGKYATPENLGEAINTQFNEFEPFIAPDESYLIFMAAGRPDSLGSGDLYLSYRQNGAWTKAVNLGEGINSSGFEISPKVSPDGKYFFWTSTRGLGSAPLEKRLDYQELTRRLRSTRNGLGDIYQIEIGALKLNSK